jgi:lysophospholipase L1-like esterase
MMVQYWGTANYNEFPLTGVLRLWTTGQLQDVPDAIAARLVAAGVGFQYDSSSLKGEPAIVVSDPLTGGATGFQVNGNTWYPSLGFPRTVALLGDSITRNNHWDGAAFQSKQFSQLGYWTFASQILGKRFYYDYTYNFGVFGERTDQVLARVPQVIAKGPSLAVVLCGINDVVAGVSASVIQANLVSIWAQLNNAGIPVVAGCIFPTSTGGFTATQAKTLLQVNNWMRRTVATLPNVHLWDSFFTLADLTSTVAGCDTNSFADNLHPNRRGAQLAGADLAAVINAIYPEVVNDRQGALYGSYGLSDVYDATNNPRGSLVTNATLAGTGGTNAGAYATGSVATGWTVYRPVGATIVCASTKNTVTMPNGQTYSEQQLVVSSPGSGAANEEISFQQALTTVVGDNIVAGAWVDISAISGRLNYVEKRIQAQYGSYTVLASDGVYSGGGVGSMLAAQTGHLQTPPVGAIACPAGGTTTNTSIVIGLDCTVASSVTLKVRLPWARKN